MARNIEHNDKQSKCANHLRKQVDSIFGNKQNKKTGKVYKYNIKVNKTDKKDKTNMNLLADALALNGVQNIKNIKQKQIDAAVRTLKEQGYSTSTIKGVVGSVHKVSERHEWKNKLQESKRVFERLEIENKRSTGSSERIWSDREYMELLKRAKEDGRHDVVYGAKLARNLLLRGMELSNLNVGQIRKAIETNELELTITKGHRPRTLTLGKTSRQILIELDGLARIERLGTNDLIFVKSLTLSHGRDGLTANKAQKDIQQYISDVRGDFQDKDRVSLVECEKASKEGIIHKSELTLHGLRSTGAWNMYNYFKDKKGVPEKTARSIVSKYLGHGGKRSIQNYIKQANVQGLDKSDDETQE